MKAVIIAAGCGSRLRSEHKGIPKTLLKIKGKRIIDDIIEKVRFFDITEIVIVTGYESEYLKNQLKNYKTTDLNIKFVHNAQWRKANGISVLTASKLLRTSDQFILMMSDHIFSSEMLGDIIKTPISTEEALLALDFKINNIPDLDDGMKVQCEQEKNNMYNIKKFGKNLAEYNAIDAGMFKLNYNFFKILKKSIEEGNCSLSDACNSLANEQKMKGLDIKNALWLDVDTPEMIEQEQILSKIFNSRI